MKMSFFCALTFLCLNAFTQKIEDQFFVFDEEWNPIKIEKAVYFLRVSQLSDSDYEWTYYNMNGPRIKQENYKDATAKIKNGKFTYYWYNGSIDSTGYYESNQMNGDWHFTDGAGKLLESKTYDRDALIKDTLYPPSVKKQINPKPGEKESEFPGGVSSWANYLIRNTHYPKRAFKQNINGEVQVSFMIDEKGIIGSIEIKRSVEYSIDEEAIRLIRESKAWIPASINGKPVKSFKIQPIHFDTGDSQF